MFQGHGLLGLVRAGGPTMYLLLGCSVLSLAVIVERSICYWINSPVTRRTFVAALVKALRKGGRDEALAVCAKVSAPFARVAAAGLSRPGAGAAVAMEREIELQTMLLERRISIVGTIGSVAVYLGLLGTVLGIIQAFGDVSQGSGEAMNAVTAGVAQALLTTAAGLVVAVPAVVAYNYFVRRIDLFVSDMELCASEVREAMEAEER
ncbi:MAG TPA: MotA/TolQ/ExbB proton channel family protein [bacterium]|jgi:biopolymer transport protein ExbB|nr:MotA/TolQ/ExbB proton channel family protein [Chlamydiota bacterium]HOE27141.1 MotA/TolQ/ExbB proton channel family protein [bacterium]HQM52306.1 MotA/TolQ/ExbB proton channel family protein [bacterium]